MLAVAKEVGVGSGTVQRVTVKWRFPPYHYASMFEKN
jgi:hypothetical protein